MSDIRLYPLSRLTSLAQYSDKAMLVVTEGTGSAADAAEVAAAIGTTPESLVTAAQAMDGTQEVSFRSATKTPKIGLPVGGLFGSRIMSGARNNHPQLRMLFFGDSITYPPINHLRSILGNGGTIGNVVNGTASDGCVLAGGATALNVIAESGLYAKSFTGSLVNLGTGTALFARAGTDPYLGRRVFVWYWSETGGGTFTVEADTNASGSYTTLKSGTLSGGALNGLACTVGGNGTIDASGVIDASEGGAGALRCITFDLPSNYFLRVRCNGAGSTGSAKIIAAGPVEIEVSSNRNPGFVGINCSFAGTQPEQWDDITDQALQVLMQYWDPQIIYVRGYETLSQWQNQFSAFAARILAIKPTVEFVIVGMHVTASDNTNDLDSVDLWQQKWCDDNNGIFIPIRNRMGTIDWCVENNLTDSLYTATATAGNSGTGVFTLTSALDASANGRWLRLESKTGGSNLIVGRAYRVLSGQGTTSMTIADYDGVTPISLGSTVTAAVFTVVDGTHSSEDGKSFMQGIVMEGMQQFLVSRLVMNGYSNDESWLRTPINTERVHSYPVGRTWSFSGPSYRRREIAVGQVDGSLTANNYYTTASFGATANNTAFIAGPNSAGFGLHWDSNFGVIGNNPQSFTRGLGNITNGFRDMFEACCVFTDTRPLAVSSAGTTSSHAPLQVWRNGASSSSKGTQVAVIDALGRFSPTIPEYANDAAADADSALPAGFLYRVTGNRAVFRKP